MSTPPNTKSTRSRSIKCFLAPKNEESPYAVEQSSPPHDSRTASPRRALLRHSSLISSCGSGYLKEHRSSCSQHYIATLVSWLPTKTELACMLYGLECTMKKVKVKISAMPSDHMHVLQWVEDSKQWLDHHTAIIKELQTHVQQLALHTALPCTNRRPKRS